MARSRIPLAICLVACLASLERRALADQPTTTADQPTTTDDAPVVNPQPVSSAEAAPPPAAKPPTDAPKSASSTDGLALRPGPTSVADDDADQAPTGLYWNPAWRDVGTTDYIITGGATALAFGGFAIPLGGGRWRGNNSFDGGVRNGLRAQTLAGRDTAADASDLLLSFSLNQLMVDALLVAWWKHDSQAVAWRMLVINTETIAIVGAISNIAKGIAARERPFGDECSPDSDDRLCNSGDRYRSYFSGHSSVSFAAASLNCMHHVHLKLYDNPVADGISCALGYGVASATGVLRMVGDRHWASDVLTGAGVGTLSGLLVPYLMHYGTDQFGGDESGRADGVTVRLVPAPTGAMLMGTF